MSFSAAAPTAHREVLAGLIERVTFRNEQNGFCVLQVKARGQRDLITVVGHAAAISPGEFIQASGAWVNDRTYGQQFRAAFCPCCAGNQVSVTNSLAALYPDIAAQWHATKNGDLTPADITAGTTIKIWWRCSNGPEQFEVAACPQILKLRRGP